MPITKPLLERVRMLAAKVETTPGTAIALTATEATHIVIAPTIRDITEKVKRELQGTLGYHPSILGVRLGEMTFSLDISAELATPTWAALFLPACGLGQTLTPSYKRDILLPGAAASTQETLTLGFYNDGTFEQLHGAAGNAIFHHVAGQVTRVDFSFRGKYTQPADLGILDPTFVDPPKLRFASSAFSIGALVPKVSMVDLDLGNKVEFREDSIHADGIEYAFISDFETLMKCDPEQSLVAEQDIAGLFALGTESAIDFKSLNGADSATFACTKGEIVSCARGARKGLSIWDIAIRDNNADLTLTCAT